MRPPGTSTSKSEEARQRGAEAGAAEHGPSNWSCSHTSWSPGDLQQGGRRETRKYFAFYLPSSCSLLPQGKAAQGTQSCPTEVTPRGRKQGRGFRSLPGIINRAYGEYPAPLSEPHPIGVRRQAAILISWENSLLGPFSKSYWTNRPSKSTMIHISSGNLMRVA